MMLQMVLIGSLTPPYVERKVYRAKSVACCAELPPVSFRFVVAMYSSNDDVFIRRRAGCPDLPMVTSALHPSDVKLSCQAPKNCDFIQHC